MFRWLLTRILGSFGATGTPVSVGGYICFTASVEPAMAFTASVDDCGEC